MIVIGKLLCANRVWPSQQVRVQRARIPCVAEPLWRDDHRVSTGAAALRPARVGAVLGRRRGARPAAEPTHGDATAGKIRGAGDRTLRDASSRATKAFYPALSMCDLIFSGVFERHPRLRVAVVEFELAWAPNVLSSMDYTYRERHGEALYRFKNGMLPSDFFRRNVVLSFQEDAIGIRLRDVIGVDNMMWGSDYPHSESTFPQSRKILAEILAGVPDDEQAKIAGANTARVYNFDAARLTVPA